jgi:hypothetical protein
MMSSEVVFVDASTAHTPTCASECGSFWAFEDGMVGN